MGTKYTYSEGATYQSESTPITIAKIPTGEYKIKAVSGNSSGKTTFEATAGTQEIILTIRVPIPYDLSNAKWSDESYYSKSGIAYNCYANVALSNISVIDASIVSKIVLSGNYSYKDDLKGSTGYGTYSYEITTTSIISSPNGEYTVNSAEGAAGNLNYSILSCTFSAYDSSGNLLQSQELSSS